MEKSPKFEDILKAKHKPDTSLDDSLLSTSGSFIEGFEQPKFISPDFFFLKEKSKALNDPFPDESELSLAPGALEKLQNYNAPLISFKDYNSVTLSKFILE